RAGRIESLQLHSAEENLNLRRRRAVLNSIRYDNRQVGHGPIGIPHGIACRVAKIGVKGALACSRTNDIEPSRCGHIHAGLSFGNLDVVYDHLYDAFYLSYP